MLFRSVAAMFAEDFTLAGALLSGLLRNPTTLPVTGAAAAACRVRLALATGSAEAARPLVADLLSRVATGASDVLLVVAAGGDDLLTDLLVDEANLSEGNPYAATALDRLWRYRRHQAAAASRRNGDQGHRAGDAAGASLLTERETSVLSCLQDGKSYEDIGNALFITPNTVKTHVQSLYRKLGVERASQAVRRGRELGLLPPT